MVKTWRFKVENTTFGLSICTIFLPSILNLWWLFPLYLFVAPFIFPHCSHIHELVIEFNLCSSSTPSISINIHKLESVSPYILRSKWIRSLSSLIFPRLRCQLFFFFSSTFLFSQLPALSSDFEWETWTEKKPEATRFRHPSFFLSCPTCLHAISKFIFTSTLPSSSWKLNY